MQAFSFIFLNFLKTCTHSFCFYPVDNKGRRVFLAQVLKQNSCFVGKFLKPKAILFKGVKVAHLQNNIYVDQYEATTSLAHGPRKGPVNFRPELWGNILADETGAVSLSKVL